MFYLIWDVGLGFTKERFSVPIIMSDFRNISASYSHEVDGQYFKVLCSLHVLTDFK